MTSALPPNIHAEVALDRGRFSEDSTYSRSPSIRRVVENRNDRVMSVHGNVEYMSPPGPKFSPPQGALAEEEERGGGMVSAADLAAMLDEEDDDLADYYSERRYDDMQPAHSSYGQGPPPRQASFNSPSAGPYPGVGAGPQPQPRPILQNPTTRSPPSSVHSRPSFQSSMARSSSVPDPHAHLQANPGMSLRFGPNVHPAGATTAPPSPTVQHPNGFMGYPEPPNSASLAPRGAYPSLQQPSPHAFPDQPRFAITDSGLASGQPHPGMRRVASDSNFHAHTDMHSEPPLSAGLTPPGRRSGGSRTPPSPSKYSTFEDMGVQGKAAQKEKDCVIM